jgi:hypothetical protein
MNQYLFIFNITSDLKDGRVSNIGTTLIKAESKDAAFKKFLLSDSDYPMAFFIEIYEGRVPSPIKNAESLKESVDYLMHCLIRGSGYGNLDELKDGDLTSDRIKTCIKRNIQKFTSVFKQYQEADCDHLQVYTIPASDDVIHL